jgi:hypothetical protein
MMGSFVEAVCSGAPVLTAQAARASPASAPAMILANDFMMTFLHSVIVI